MLTPAERGRLMADRDYGQTVSLWALLTVQVREAVSAVLDQCGIRTECAVCATEVWPVKLANGKKYLFDSAGELHDNCESFDGLYGRCHAVIRDDHEDPAARYAAAIRSEMRRFLETLGTPARCKGCEVIIYWVLHRNGRRTPYSQDGVNHWQDCAASKEMRERYPRRRKT